MLEYDIIYSLRLEAHPTKNPFFYRRYIMYTHFSIELEIASMIADTTIAHLTNAQVTYLSKIMEQLPEPARNIIYSKANGNVPADHYVSVHKLHLEDSLNIARELIDLDVLTISSQPISKVLEMANGDTAKSYDEIVKAICEDRINKLRDPYICNEAYHTLRDEVNKECSLALYDCHKLLASEAYTGELASFRKAITSKFTPREWDSKPTNYANAIKMIKDIAEADAEGDEHYAKVVETTIGAFYRKLFGMLTYQTKLTARKLILFKELPVYANIKDIGWALNIDPIGLEDDFPIANEHCRRDLLSLDFRTMSNLTNPVAKMILEPHTELYQKVEQALKFALG